MILESGKTYLKAAEVSSKDSFHTLGIKMQRKLTYDSFLCPFSLDFSLALAECVSILTSVGQFTFFMMCANLSALPAWTYQSIEIQEGSKPPLTDSKRY